MIKNIGKIFKFIINRLKLYKGFYFWYTISLITMIVGDTGVKLGDPLRLTLFAISTFSIVVSIYFLLRAGNKIKRENKNLETKFDWLDYLYNAKGKSKDKKISGSLMSNELKMSELEIYETLDSLNMIDSDGNDKWIESNFLSEISSDIETNIVYFSLTNLGVDHYLESFVKRKLEKNEGKISRISIVLSSFTFIVQFLPKLLSGAWMLIEVYL